MSNIQGQAPATNGVALPRPPMVRTNVLDHWLRDIRLRRITTSSKYIPQVDGLRFIAICAVLIDHTINQGVPFMREGGLLSAIAGHSIGFRGVYLFFTLSGFILALPFARQFLQQDQPVNIAAYFKRRLTRLEPPFIVAMLFRLIAFLAFSAMPAATILVHFFASLFYLHSAIYGPGSSINRPAWSLEVEVQFYILAPLLAMLFRVRPTWLRRSVLVALIFGVALAARMPMLLYNQRLSFSIACNLQYFLAGFLVCDLYVLRDFHDKRSWYWDLAGIAGLIFAFASSASQSEVFIPIANIAICLAAFYGHLVPRFLALSFVSIVGGMCYSIYLTHNSVLTGAHSLLLHFPFLLLHKLAFNVATFSVSLTATLFVGTLFFILIERPCMDPQWPSKAISWLTGKRPQRSVQS